jgi:hypothetical protein
MPVTGYPAKERKQQSTKAYSYIIVEVQVLGVSLVAVSFGGRFATVEGT